LVVDEVTMVDGKVTIPQRPGLGIEINRDALEMFKDAARKIRA
jgi:L-alanine-DL-glutamate epimerase-like enolase superfamily enzyme